MTITQFLALFPVVKETKNGWDVNCPAHDDQSPSLGVMVGEADRIVLHCLAHCTNEAILDRLGLTWLDLFPDQPLNGTARPSRLPAVKLSPAKRAFLYDLRAMELRQKADTILAAAGHCVECDTWTDEERELAMRAVAPAYTCLDRAQFCEDYADHLREVAYVAP